MLNATTETTITSHEKHLAPAKRRKPRHALGYLIGSDEALQQLKTYKKKVDGIPVSALNATIKKLVRGNPKLGTAKSRFDLYKSGMTVQQYLNAGGLARDLPFDIAHGYIELDFNTLN